MKKIVAVLLASMVSFGALAEKVCVDVKDPKTGKVTQQCKDIKKHKKLEGTEVPKK